MKKNDMILLFCFIIFVLMVMLGIESGVSWTVILWRAILATVVIGILLYGLVHYFSNYLLPDVYKPEEQVEDIQEKGLQVDMMAGQEDDLTSIINSPVIETPSAETPSPQQTNTQFKPFTPQQIDPEIQKIIKENPEQAAEVVRKMGLDQ